jgi:hypothetical protein
MSKSTIFTESVLRSLSRYLEVKWVVGGSPTRSKIADSPRERAA